MMVSFLLAIPVLAYTHSSCTRRTRHEFQFPDCYLPSLNNDLSFTQASFVYSHNAATGYIHKNSLSKTGLSASYSQTQVGTLYQQLQDGARALDVRPLLLRNGTVIFQHDSIRIPVIMEQLVIDTLQWCAEHPNELVLWLPNHFQYETQDTIQFRDTDDDAYRYLEEQYSDDDASFSLHDAMSSILERFQIPHFDCSDVHELTVGDVMDMAQLPDHGGSILVLMNENGNLCGKENWLSGNRMVSCVYKGHSCTTSNVPWQELRNTILQSVHNEPTDDRNVLGPPASTYYTPLNEVQAFWQVDLNSVLSGISKFSSILQDNQRSHLNAELVDMVYDQELESISLLGVDNVHLHGNALLSVVRNQCGQQDDSTFSCGQDLPHPIVRDEPHWVVYLLTIYGVWVVASVWYCKRPKLLYTAVARCFEKRSSNDDNTQELIEERGVDEQIPAAKPSTGEGR